MNQTFVNIHTITRTKGSLQIHSTWTCSFFILTPFSNWIDFDYRKKKSELNSRITERKWKKTNQHRKNIVGLYKMESNGKVEPNKCDNNNTNFEYIDNK